MCSFPQASRAATAACIVLGGALGLAAPATAAAAVQGRAPRPAATAAASPDAVAVSFGRAQVAAEELVQRLASAARADPALSAAFRLAVVVGQAIEPLEFVDHGASYALPHPDPTAVA